MLFSNPNGRNDPSGRSKIHVLGLFGILGLLAGCAKSEKLDDNEMQYVKNTIMIAKVRTVAHDSVQLATKLDSIYKKLGLTKESYLKQTTDFAKEPDRAAIVFRAIADSLNVK
jgi:hypothetical protein